MTRAKLQRFSGGAGKCWGTVELKRAQARNLAGPVAAAKLEIAKRRLGSSLMISGRTEHHALSRNKAPGRRSRSFRSFSKSQDGPSSHLLELSSST